MFGELTHGGCAYNHDLRGELFSKQGEGLWRRFEHLNRNGNLYPTHGLGPVAHYMDINRGDRFERMVSMSSLSASLQAYRKEHLAADDPRQKEIYKEGDFNTSLIRTAKGRVIELEHNVSSPAALRPHQPDCGDQGDLPRLSAADLRGRRRAGRFRPDRPLQGEVRAPLLEGYRGARAEARAATAAWTS